MTTGLSRLQMAAGASTFWRPSDILSVLRRDGVDGLVGIAETFDALQLETAQGLGDALAARGFDVIAHGDGSYPTQLNDLRSPPPLLYWAGALELISRDGVGMCGSRHASDAGLRAARACGTAVASSGLVVISGNARGVDTQAHEAALEAGGGTILVLAEGPLQFRQRKGIAERAEATSVLVLSQFAPRMAWNVGNAMTRNGVIAALGRALVVIEAGSEGGTLDAGIHGLQIGRPVIALQFETTGTPPGNAILHGKGAIPVSSPTNLKASLDMIAREGPAQQRLQLGAL